MTPETREVEEVETKPTVNAESELTSNRKEYGSPFINNYLNIMGPGEDPKWRTLTISYEDEFSPMMIKQL